MKKIRNVIIYKDYFEEFFVKQTQKTKRKELNYEYKNIRPI